MPEPCNCGELTCATCGFGPVIGAYTRAQALADGVLVDAGPMAREAGFTIPVALTRAAWTKCVEVPPEVFGQDETGRLWDVLNLLGFEIRRSGGTRNEIRFRLHVRDSNRDGTPPLVTLRAVCGPDDDGSPCVTVLMPDED